MELDWDPDPDPHYKETLVTGQPILVAAFTAVGSKSFSKQ